MESTPITETTVDEATGEQGYRLPSGEVVTYGDYLAIQQKAERAEELEAELSEARRQARVAEDEAETARRVRDRDNREKLSDLIREGVRPDVNSELFAPFFRRAIYMAYRAGNCTEAEAFAKEAGLENLEIWHEGTPTVSVGFTIDAPELEFLAQRAHVSGEVFTGRACCEDDDYCECDNQREAVELSYMFDGRNWLRSEEGRAQLVARLEQILEDVREGSLRNISATTTAISSATPSNRNATEWLRTR